MFLSLSSSNRMRPKKFRQEESSVTELVPNDTVVKFWLSSTKESDLDDLWAQIRLALDGYAARNFVLRVSFVSLYFTLRTTVRSLTRSRYTGSLFTEHLLRSISVSLFPFLYPPLFPLSPSFSQVVHCFIRHSHPERPSFNIIYHSTVISAFPISSIIMNHSEINLWDRFKCNVTPESGCRGTYLVTMEHEKTIY